MCMNVKVGDIFNQYEPHTLLEAQHEKAPSFEMCPWEHNYKMESLLSRFEKAA